MNRIKLEDLPEKFRLQAQRQLAAATPRQIAQDAPQATARLQTAPPQDATQQPKRSTLKQRQPNDTELEYNRVFLLGTGVFEALSLKLPGGSHYKPDWKTVQDGQVTLHEVKGSFRFGSHGRARTAFREAVAAFPEFKFVWATKRKKADGGWEVEHA